MAGDFSTGLSTGVSAAMDAIARNGNNGNDKVAGAAKDFEALLLGQILKSAHGDSGWLGTDDDDAGEAALGFAEEQLARSMALSGGVGLSRLIESGIDNQQKAIDSVRTPPLTPVP